MSELKQTIRQNVSLPSARSIQSIIGRGRVIYSNERENVVTVIYTDRNGKSKTENGVPVRIDSADSWFPMPGDVVLLDVSNTAATVIGRDVTDYNSQIRQAHRLLYDIFSDASSPIGNQIG